MQDKKHIRIFVFIPLTQKLYAEVTYAEGSFHIFALEPIFVCLFIAACLPNNVANNKKLTNIEFTRLCDLKHFCDLKKSIIEAESCHLRKKTRSRVKGNACRLLKGNVADNLFVIGQRGRRRGPGK